jgi:pSer/pThr/pTyr-binding forkhead associated (FHA) protein
LEADETINDPSMSSRHATLECIDDAWFIEDLDSTNGTFVNGERVTRRSVANGDVVHLGGVRLDFTNGKLLQEGDPQRFQSITDANSTVVEELKPRTIKTRVGGFAIVVVLLVVLIPIIKSLSGGTKNASLSNPEMSTLYVVASSSTGDICWAGSGALVLDGRYVLTNAHIAQPESDATSADRDCTKLKVGYTDNANSPPTVFRTASIADISENLDLALLEIQNPLSGRTSFQINSVAPALGTSIRVFGYPGIGGDTLTLTNGVISGIDSSDGTKYFKVSASIAYGASGGPVVDESGRLIGIATAFQPAEVNCKKDGSCFSEGQSLGLVRPIEFAVAWLNSRS